MFDPREYREVCRELRAPEKKIEEIIAMTEQRTHKRRLRALGTGLAACAAAATMVVGVAAANPEAAQEFFAHITSVVTVGEFRRDLTTEEGEQVTVLELPQATVENRDGRAILVVDGEETDVTDQLESTGSYTCTASSNGTQVDITVEGSAAEWTLTTEVKTTEGLVYTLSSDSDGNSGTHFEGVKGDAETAVSTYDGACFAEPRSEGELER